MRKKDAWLNSQAPREASRRAKHGAPPQEISTLSQGGRTVISELPGSLLSGLPLPMVFFLHLKSDGKRPAKQSDGHSCPEWGRLPAEGAPAADRTSFKPPRKTLSGNQSKGGKPFHSSSVAKKKFITIKAGCPGKTEPALSQESSRSIGIEILEDRTRQQLPQLMDRPLVGDGQLLRIATKQDSNLLVGLPLHPAQ